MRYEGMVIRPPSEADSCILQVTYGCSHDRCTFCGTYMDKPFQVRPIQEVLEDVALARAEIPGAELYRQRQAGRFELPEPLELLGELRQVIANTDGLSRCVFRTNHASNYLPLAGTLSREKTHPA
jgi:hypothetical protein